MKKYLTLALLSIVFLSIASGDVYYEIDAGDDSVRMNTTLELECDTADENCPVNRWRLTWDLPEGSDLISIEDSLGEVDDYTKDGDQVSLRTNRGDRRDSETVRIRVEIDGKAEEIHKGLFKRKLNLAGFSDQETRGIVRNPELISGWTGKGFETSYSEKQMNFTGEGSTSVRINFGKGHKTEYYEFFGDKPSNTSLAYEVSVGMTGLTQGFERFPVAVMDKNDYDGSVVQWSAGEYVGGSFRMRKSLEDDFLPVLAHETVHGLNERKLKWDTTSSTWLDEGTSKYVETLVNLHLKGKQRTRKLFGENTTYTVSRNGTRYRVTAPSSGDPERLWNYYQNDREFMKNWNPRDYPDERSFGYAYSELIIRNHIARENNTLRELYRQMDFNRRIESNQEKWNLLSRYLDLKPCNYNSREKFNSCLQEINSYDYYIFRAQNISRKKGKVSLEPIEIKEIEDETLFGNTTVNGTERIQRTVQNGGEKASLIISRFFENLREFFISVLGGLGV